VGGPHHAPAALPPGKTRYPLYRRLGGPQGRSGRMRKISPPPGFDPRTVQPVASRLSPITVLNLILLVDSFPVHKEICCGFLRRNNLARQVLGNLSGCFNTSFRQNVPNGVITATDLFIKGTSGQSLCEINFTLNYDA
jgi:hypothetical protein